MNNYTPQAGDTLVPGATGVTELKTIFNKVIAACGQAAVDAALIPYGLATGAAAEVTALVRQGVGAGQVVGSKGFAGQSSPSNLIWLAQQHGLTLQSQSYAQASPWFGIKPVVIGVNNGAALGDTGVAGHYVTAEGKTASGNIILSDPNSSASLSGGFTQVTPAQLQQASPFFFGVPSSLPSAGGNQGPILGGGVTSAVGGVVGSLIASLGIDVGDFFARTGLIVAGGLLVLLGLAALLFDREDVGAVAGAAARAA